VSIESEKDLESLRRVGRVVRITLERMRAAVTAGITTADLDDIAERSMREHGSRSAPMLFYGFPGWTCISVNDEVVHGIPGGRVLAKGDMVTLDVTAELDGYVADAAITVVVPPASPVALALCECAEAAFWKGHRAARAGAPIRDVGMAVETEVSRRGFRVLRELCGHGVGRHIHERPSVPNWPDPRVRSRLTEGLVIALEPLICETTEWSRDSDDGWTVLSADGGLTAHFEHTIAITGNEAMVLTA
jgi:methionyl aminopeptidase